jgi:hypothetical protein
MSLKPGDEIAKQIDPYDQTVMLAFDYWLSAAENALRARRQGEEPATQEHDPELEHLRNMLQRTADNAGRSIDMRHLDDFTAFVERWQETGETQDLYSAQRSLKYAARERNRLSGTIVMEVLPHPSTVDAASPSQKTRHETPKGACTTSIDLPVKPSWNSKKKTLTYAGEVVTLKKNADSVSEVFDWFQARQWAAEVKIDGYDIIEHIGHINNIVSRANGTAKKVGFTIGRKGDLLKWSDPRLSAK